MKSSTQDKVEGALHKVKGKVKETIGEIVENPDLKAEGKIEKIQGKVQEKRGQIKKVLGE